MAEQVKNLQYLNYALFKSVIKSLVWITQPSDENWRKSDESTVLIVWGIYHIMPCAYLFFFSYLYNFPYPSIASIWILGIHIYAH